ncbi:MAG: hypothetical protein H0T65_02585 [Deltaproteobacteria bacterium]|nr:hypothetical protein [Deltaproteobacteria bacterium]
MLPTLAGDIVKPGDTLQVSSGPALVTETYMNLADGLAWGWNDLESGEDAVDGFPALT